MLHKNKKGNCANNMSETPIALPGQLLGGAHSTSLGPGTHLDGTQVYASIAGPLISTPTTAKPSKSTTAAPPSITRPSGPLLLPEVGSIVLGKITRTNPRQATLSILALGSTGAHVLHEPFSGLIRQQDIRATEIDKVKVSESFRVGDVVRAAVISLGDERSYYLSTARNELGVVMAVSEWGNQMLPVSWREFWDREMGVREARKVAKPV